MRPCPLCDGPGTGPVFPYATVWRDRTFHYQRCADCGCVYVDPLPSSADFEAMYARDHYHDAHYAEVNAGGAYQASAELLLRFAEGRRTLLDFGCGNGSFLLAAARAGFEGYGVEYEAKAIESAGRNANVPVSDLATLRASGRRFDIIHLGDVFEHLPTPKQTIDELARFLRPNGLFFVEGPLEANPSLVHYASRALRGLRRALGGDVTARIAPMHLILVDRRAQESFFVRTMGFRKLYFEVVENGWPYCSKEPVRSIRGLARRGLGYGAIALARAAESVELPPLGNRFVSLFEAQDVSMGSSAGA